MSTMKDWENRVLAAPGAAERVSQIEDELKLAAGLTRLREQAGLSQREVAERIGVRQPRIAAIERCRNVTVDVLERYVAALGGRLELSVIKGGKRIALVSGNPDLRPAEQPPGNGAAATASGVKKAPAKTARAKRAGDAAQTPVQRPARKKSA